VAGTSRRPAGRDAQLEHQLIFRSALFSRRADLTEAQFGAHWLRVHGELARHMPGVHRYLQNHIRERLLEVQPFPSHEVGGISQQWFDDVAGMERCERSPEYAAVKRDIPNFQGAITILVLQGAPVIDAPVEGRDLAKLLVLSRLRTAATPQAEVLQPLAQTLLQAGGPPPIRVVQNFVVDRAHPVSAQVPQGQAPVDAMAELWFDGRETLHGWLESNAGRDFVHGQQALEPLAAYAVDEIRIV
jgi:uncharacterized protein (TIGR02118 family)